MKKMRFAVASTDGANVDTHFGKAERFLVFDLDEQLKLIEIRPSERLSVDDPNHPFDPDKFGRVVTLLKDCSRVYVARIGDMPAAKLKEMGIAPVVYSGPIAH